MSEENSFKDSGSESSLDEKMDIQILSSADALEEGFRRRQQLLNGLQKLKNALIDTENEIMHLDNSYYDEIPQFYPSDLESCISPIVSPIHQSDRSSEAFNTSSDSENASEIEPNMACRNFKEINDYCANLAQEVNESTEFKKYLPNPEALERAIKTQTKQVFSNKSPLKGSNNICQETKEAVPSSEIEVNVESMESSISNSKGKEAENPRFRYKKQSKPMSLSRESQSDKTRIKQLNEALVKRCTPEQKCTKLKSPIGELTRISPAIKRKGPDSSKDNDKQHLQLSCARSLPFSKSTGNVANDNALKLSKKLKFENDEKPTEQSLNLVPFLSQTNNGFSEIVDEQQINVWENFNENEQLVFPYSSSIIDVSPEHISLTDKMNDVSVILEELSPESISEDTMLSERIESSLAIASRSVPISERKEPSLSGADGESSTSREETFLPTTMEEYKLLKPIEEPKRKEPSSNVEKS